MRTVVFANASAPSALCDVPHAVTQRSDAGACCSVAVADPRSTAKPAITAILDRTEAVVMVPSLPPGRSCSFLVSGWWSAVRGTDDLTNYQLRTAHRCCV